MKDRETLRDKFIAETGQKLWAEDFKEDVGFSDKYVAWLESQVLSQEDPYYLHLDTLLAIKRMFEYHSDYSVHCNGYHNLCNIIEEKSKAKNNEFE